MKQLAHQRPGLRAGNWPLAADQIQAIAAAAFEVLARSGVLVFSDTAMAALAEAGAEVDAESRRVRLSRAMVEDAIDANPSSITLYSRDGANDCVLEADRVHYATGGTAIYVLDPDSGRRRPSTVADVILNARMVEALENIHAFTINVFPHDVEDRDAIDVNRFFHALDHTNKHVMGGLYSMAGCQRVVAMCERIAGGAEALAARPFVSFITLIISPFKIDRDYGEMACRLAARGLPVVVPTEPICATTSPITLAGNVLTHVAETLAGITLIQSVRKGAPGICGSVGSITNLHTMDHLGGPIERAMINAAVAQMAQHYRLPLYSTGGTTDAKALNVQAAYESAMSSLMVATSGANFIHDIAGLMESDLTVSYEKLVVDNEILGMCQRVLRGIEVTEETLAVEMLIDKGPGADYFAEEHTIRHLRSEFYQPELANRDTRDHYDPADDAMARAKARVAEIRAAAPTSCLDAGVREQILAEFGEILQPPGTPKEDTA